MDEKHQYFIRPRKAQVPIKKWLTRVFDFEADTAAAHHVASLATVIDELEHVTYTCHENHGDSVLDQFIEGEIYSKKYRGFTFIAHNAREYDAQFIRQELDKRRVKYDKIAARSKNPAFDDPSCTNSHDRFTFLHLAASVQVSQNVWSPNHCQRDVSVSVQHQGKLVLCRAHALFGKILA